MTVPAAQMTHHYLDRLKLSKRCSCFQGVFGCSDGGCPSHYEFGVKWFCLW